MYSQMPPTFRKANAESVSPWPCARKAILRNEGKKKLTVPEDMAADRVVSNSSVLLIAYPAPLA
jgi:hypothetical protein